MQARARSHSTNRASSNVQDAKRAREEITTRRNDEEVKKDATEDTVGFVKSDDRFVK